MSSDGAPTTASVNTVSPPQSDFKYWFNALSAGQEQGDPRRDPHDGSSILENDTAMQNQLKVHVNLSHQKLHRDEGNKLKQQQSKQGTPQIAKRATRNRLGRL
eukprot:scpid109940/ scgid22012/ 